MLEVPKASYSVITPFFQISQQLLLAVDICNEVLLSTSTEELEKDRVSDYVPLRSIISGAVANLSLQLRYLI